MKKSKCVFLTESVTYLGHRIDTQGLHPVEAKIKALLEAPVLTNITALKSFLEMVMYCTSFFLICQQRFYVGY